MTESKQFFSNDPLLTDDEVATMLHMSVVTVWRHVAKGKLPRPIKLGRLSRWPRSEIIGHIEKAKAARGVPYRVAADTKTITQTTTLWVPSGKVR